MKAIIETQRKSLFMELSGICTFVKEEGDFIETTEWSNGEGFDVVIDNISGVKMFSLTWGEFKALKKLVKALDK